MRGRKIILLFILGIFLIGVAAAGTYCCEKTKLGAWCQNVNTESECDITSINPVTSEPFKSTNAFCESTDYCRPGTCVNNLEGTCIPSPKSVCFGNGGFWSEQTKSELEQCKLGCCLIGDQAAFVTQTACNRMSANYGLNIDWRGNINDEFTCLIAASPSEKGACVFTKNYVKTCGMTTKEKCQNEIAKNSAYSDVEFHGGYLCSAQAELGTSCAPTGRTVCDDKDDVRFVDSCNQLGNIYDYAYSPDNPGKNANYLTDYWTMMKEPTCSNNAGNKDSATCGDCDYLSGSMCKKKGVGESVSSGEYLCKNLDCVGYNKESFDGTNSYPKHGETWCVTDNITSGYNPGTTFFRKICYDGEVTIEECGVPDSTRQEICNEKVSENGFRMASCKVNLWGDCYTQTSAENCLDVNLRDCNWLSGEQWNGYSFFTGDEGTYLSDTSTQGEVGACVPKFQPGFERDTSQNVGGTSCTSARAVCNVRMIRGAFGGEWKCKEGGLDGKGNNCYCIDDANGNYDSGATWASSMNKICVQMGDCGIKNNFLNKPGFAYSDVIKMLNISE